MAELSIAPFWWATARSLRCQCRFKFARVHGHRADGQKAPARQQSDPNIRRVGRNFVSNQVVISIAPLSTKRSRYLIVLSR